MRKLSSTFLSGASVLKCEGNIRILVCDDNIINRRLQLMREKHILPWDFGNHLCDSDFSQLKNWKNIDKNWISEANQTFPIVPDGIFKSPSAMLHPKILVFTSTPALPSSSKSSMKGRENVFWYEAKKVGISSSLSHLLSLISPILCSGPPNLSH